MFKRAADMVWLEMFIQNVFEGWIGRGEAMILNMITLKPGLIGSPLLQVMGVALLNHALK